MPRIDLDRERLIKYSLIRSLSSLPVSDRVLYCDFPLVPIDRYWIVPYVTAWFTAAYVAGPPASQFLLTIALCDGAEVQPTVAPASQAPPVALINDAAGAFDVGPNRRMVLALQQDPFAITPNSAAVYGAVTAGGGHDQEIIVPPNFFLRAILTRNDATGPFPPAGSILGLTAFRSEELLPSATPNNPDCL